jgi:hypothetical protein
MAVEDARSVGDGANTVSIENATVVSVTMLGKYRVAATSIGKIWQNLIQRS